ncbi:MAG: hypothetical protein H7226_14200 [Salinibacterium sp.]|nr:hypothetical protein [Salinibacterium sp.]
MKRVAYGGESFITSDEGAAALLDFAASAAMSGVAEVVALPAVLPDGQVITVNLVIGPSSELITSPVETSLAEPDTREAAASLRARALQIGESSSPAHGAAISGGDLDSADPDPGGLELY